MSFRNKFLTMALLPGLFLAGCSGGSGDEFNLGNGGGDFTSPPSDTDTDTDTSPDGAASSSVFSYLPLAVHENSDSFAGEGSGGLFQGELYNPLTFAYMIKPFNVNTLVTATNATASDFKVTVNDVEIDPTENFPIFQKVVGNTVQLRTALVFDLTNSMSSADYAKLFAEAKAYVTAAKAHANPIIANQQFVVWGFGHNDPTQANVYEETVGFTDVQANIELAIDSLQNKVTAGINDGAPSPLHKAVVQAVGRYQDLDADPAIDFATDGNNDLYDRVTSNGIFLSQMVLFSSGPDTSFEFEQGEMIDAMRSQGFAQLDPGESSGSLQDYTNKAIFYYVVGSTTPGNTYVPLSNEAEVTRSLSLVNGAYSFSDFLLADQQAALNSRVDLDEQYVFRYAFLPRQGDHVVIFASRSSNYNYTLTTEFQSEDFIDNNWTTLGTPSSVLASLVEITGPNGEYLSADQASLTDVSTFKPATRWTTTVYNQADDYTWVLTGGAGVENADGSYTVNSIVGASAVLELTNTVRNETASIVITN